MTVDQFIRINNIEPADAIMLSKKFFGMLDHFAIYIGTQDNNHRFVANYTSGVKIIPDNEIVQFIQILEPKGVSKFPGNDFERSLAVLRALSRVGENAYNILSNNCEHFKNWVHFGIESSPQVENFGVAIAGGGLLLSALGLSTKNDTLTVIGIGTALIGAIAYGIGKQPNDQTDKNFLP